MLVAKHSVPMIMQNGRAARMESESEQLRESEKRKREREQQRETERERKELARLMLIVGNVVGFYGSLKS